MAAPEGEIAAATHTLVVGPYLSRTAAASTHRAGTGLALGASAPGRGGRPGRSRSSFEVVVRSIVPAQPRPHPARDLSSASGKVEEIAGIIAAREMPGSW